MTTKYKGNHAWAPRKREGDIASMPLADLWLGDAVVVEFSSQSGGCSPELPTRCMPGTAGKFAVLSARVDAGLPLFLDGDATETDFMIAYTPERVLPDAA